MDAGVSTQYVSKSFVNAPNSFTLSAQPSETGPPSAHVEKSAAQASLNSSFRVSGAKPLESRNFVV